MPSKLSWTLQGIGFSIFTAAAGFSIWTKHSAFEPLDPSTDPTFKSLFFKRYNPNNNPTFHDVCVRRYPLTKLDPELVRDAEAGGSKLVERFAQGVWGGKGFAVQREYLRYKYQSPRTAHQLWTKQQLLTNRYEVGTELTDHFAVLDRPDNNTILFRCGDSPLNNPTTPRPGDGLFEMSAKANFDEGCAEFRLKSIFYQGEGTAEKAPFEGERFMPWAHRMYDKLWMEGAVSRCKQRMTDIDWDVVMGRKAPEESRK